MSGVPFRAGFLRGEATGSFCSFVSCSQVACGPSSVRRRGEFDFTSPGPYHVLGIEDGETLVLDGNFAVRLLGVDGAAQENPFAARAAELLRRRIEGREITIALDRDRRDSQGRILAYVYCDGSLLNEELIRAGFFRADTSVNVERQWPRG